MRLFTLASALVFGAAVVHAQSAPSQEKKLFASAADVAGLIAKSKTYRKNEPNVPQNILTLAPYVANMEYRASVGPASQHDTEAEMFYVIDGAATMVTGGKLVGEKRTNAENWSGTAIEGGSSRAITKGDFIMVPEKTPHWFSSINGTLILMSLHLPKK